jgi:predicted permease
MGFLNRLAAIFRRKRIERDLDEELQHHIELKTQENIDAGMPPEEARYAALRAFGGVEQKKEQCRDADRLRWLEDLIQDLRYGLRQLRRNPGFTAVAVFTLALGIGANTAIFSVVNGVLLRPLAYRESQQLYLIQEIIPQMAKYYPLLPANLPNFLIWQKDCHSFADIAIAEGASADLTGGHEAEEVHGVRASANLFDVLGVRPALGRNFLAEEDEPGRGHVVILTYPFWCSQFHTDPAVVGRTITLDGAPYVVVGVLSASFHFSTNLGQLVSFAKRLDFFEPLNGPKDDERGLIGEFDFAAIGRLKPGVSPAQALAELNVVQAQIVRQANVSGLDLKAAIFPLESEVVGSARRGLILLLAAVGAVLVIVCANLANLQLARVPGRMREAAIRVALGATRWQLLRRMLTESLLLAVIGGGMGVCLASFGIDVLVRAAPPGLPRLDEVHIDESVFAFAVLLSILTGTLFGVLPAWRTAASDPQEALKSGSLAAGESRRSRRLRETLVGFEVGLSTLLLIVAGLLASSLIHLMNLNPGFATESVLAADVDLPPQSYAESATRLHFYNILLDRLRALPGVSAVGWVSKLPLEGETSVTGIDVPPGRPVPPSANYRVVSPDYFKAMGIPLIAGRIFNESDRSRKLVVISKSVAQRFWPGQNAIGKTCLTEWGPPEKEQVVGVVGDIRTVSLAAPPVMMVYVLGTVATRVPQSAGIVVRTSGEARGLAAEVRETIHQMDPVVPIIGLSPISELLSESAAPRRFPTLLALLFAFFALFLASLGIYGVIAYSVEQRNRELGIRAALGAQFSDLRRMVLHQGMTPVVAGLVAGISASFLIGRLIESLLFGVRPLDFPTLAVVTSAVVTVALAACYIPARRAARVEPMVALRHE